jgi:DNA-binding transcriptional LysR family regulator
MEITRLRSFVMLAERLHFGQTAELLNLSQPALSKQIRLLESEIGAPLFIRDRHGVKLTEAGRSFLREARKLVQQFDEVYEKGKRIAQGQEGTLSIGFGFSTVTLVPRLVSRFRAIYPNVEIKLQDLPTFRQIEGLQARRTRSGTARKLCPRERGGEPQQV